ncbi:MULTISPECIES: hypothetical protein [unclassified Streptomyces]|uniref:hypothetical protein n=1 Tax=unclassified Streptomyces TaxID=2593676 RepID=UPI002DDA0204|nr:MULTISPECIES: hypothetical protein [unclassified Streptomyces]
MAAFSIPEQQRHVRHRVRSYLRWLGFAPLFDGLWVSAHADPAALEPIFRAAGEPPGRPASARPATWSAAVAETPRSAGVGGRTPPVRGAAQAPRSTGSSPASLQLSTPPLAAWRRSRQG